MKRELSKEDAKAISLNFSSINHNLGNLLQKLVAVADYDERGDVAAMVRSARVLTDKAWDIFLDDYKEETD